MNVSSEMKKLVIIFFCIYIISGILNFSSFDFYGNVDPLTIFSSFVTYIFIAIITEMEVFLNKDITHLQLCLLFWAIHLFIMIIALIFPDFGIALFLFIITPSIGIFNTLTGEWQTFVFPFFCLIEVMQLTALLLWNKYAKQGT